MLISYGVLVLATKATCSPIQPTGADGARHGAEFWDAEKLDSVLTFKFPNIHGFQFLVT